MKSGKKKPSKSKYITNVECFFAKRFISIVSTIDMFMFTIYSRTIEYKKRSKDRIETNPPIHHKSFNPILLMFFFLNFKMSRMWKYCAMNGSIFDIESRWYLLSCFISKCCESTITLTCHIASCNTTFSIDFFIRLHFNRTHLDSI